MSLIETDPLTSNLSAEEKSKKHNEFLQVLQAHAQKREELKIAKEKHTEETQNPEEQIETVKINFKKIHDEIEGVISELKKTASVEREVVNSLWDSLSALRDYFAQISFSLSNYDQWTLKQKINTLELGIQELNLKIPRTKFRFKRKAQIQAKQKKTTKKDLEKQDEFVQTIKGLSDLKDKTITVKQEELDSNYKLFDLENCTINLEGSIQMLFLRNLKNCTVNTCPVANSIMGHFLIDCQINLLGHQVVFSNLDPFA